MEGRPAGSYDSTSEWKEKMFFKKSTNIQTKKAATLLENLDSFIMTPPPPKKNHVNLSLYRLSGLDCPGGRSFISLKDVVPGRNKSRRSLAVCKKKNTKSEHTTRSSFRIKHTDCCRHENMTSDILFIHYVQISSWLHLRTCLASASPGPRPGTT